MFLDNIRMIRRVYILTFEKKIRKSLFLRVFVFLFLFACDPWSSPGTYPGSGASEVTPGNKVKRKACNCLYICESRVLTVLEISLW